MVGVVKKFYVAKKIRIIPARGTCPLVGSIVPESSGLWSQLVKTTICPPRRITVAGVKKNFNILIKF